MNSASGKLAEQRVSRRFRVLATAACLVASLAIDSPARPDPGIDLSDFQLSFDETFRSLSISGSGAGTRWSGHTPWHGDFGDAVFDDPSPSGPFKIGPDGLQIAARRDAAGRWHSGLICSVDKDGPGKKGFTQKFGYFEIKARLPSGSGTWPAFWLIGEDKSVAASEIDVMEYFGGFPAYFHNWLHLFVHGHDELAKDHLMRVPSGSLSSDFHTYGVLVDPDVTEFYLDRRKIWSVPTPAEYRQPMYMLVDLAIGGGWPSANLPSPAIMTVAYVRVFQRRFPLSASKLQGCP